nr:MAG TPA: hypothetical protein [Caudoviricetes sp.]
MKRKTNKKLRCNCFDCKYAGPVVNFMVSCSIHGCKRSVGVRMCPYFEKMNDRQDNIQSDR